MPAIKCHWHVLGFYGLWFLYADDLVLMPKSEAELKQNLLNLTFIPVMRV